MANSDPVGALMRGMDILKLIGSAENGLRVCDIASALDLKQPTCYNLVRTLLFTGFVEKRKSRLYLGRELIRMLEKHSLNQSAAVMEPELLSLHRRLSQATVILAVPGMSGLVQTHRISFDRPGVIQHLHSNRLQLYTSAAGLVYLAFIADELTTFQIDELCPFADFGARAWGTREHLDAYLEKVRKDKFAVSPFEQNISLRVSAPVFDADERFAAVIGTKFPFRSLQKTDEDLVCREVLASAGKLSALLAKQH